MPNYCTYTMKIVGIERNCEEFVKRLRSYDEPNHFWRIFESDVYDREDCGCNKAFYIYGDCAWSLESCCRASGYSNGIDLFSLNTKELHLKLEAYSNEYGIGFQEHYIYDNGECLVDRCVDACAYYWDKNEFPTYAEFKSEYPDAPAEHLFVEDEDVIVGGFGDEYEHWHI